MINSTDCLKHKDELNHNFTFIFSSVIIQSVHMFHSYIVGTLIVAEAGHNEHQVCVCEHFV